MLYDILPPTIFFLSLGGIALIVGRVVVRVRQQAFSANVRSTATQVAVANSPDPAQLLKPDQKSVQAIGNRLTHMVLALKQIGSNLAAVPSRLRARQSERAQQPEQVAPRRAVLKSVGPVGHLPEGGVTNPAAPAVTAPTSAFRERLQGFGKRVTAARQATSEALNTRRAARTAAKEQVLEQPEAASPAATLQRRTLPSTAPTSALESTTPTTTHSAIKTRLVDTDQSTPTKTAATTSAAPAASELTQVHHVSARKLQRRTRRPSSILQQANEALAAEDYQRAEDILVAHIVKHTKDTDAYMLLGQAALGREAWEEAIEIFEQVVTWSKNQDGIHAVLGYASYRAGRYTKALEALQRAHEEDPDDITVLKQLMSIARKLDNPALQHSIAEKLIDYKKRQQKTTSSEAAVSTPKTKS